MRINLKDSIVSRIILRKFGENLSVRKIIRLARVDPEFANWIKEEERKGRRWLALKLAIARETMKRLSLA